MQDTTRIDTICLIVRQDSLGLLYDTKVIKTKYRKQQPFTASLLGKLRNTFVDAKLKYTDGQGKTGIRLGARVDKEKEGLRLHLFPEDPILAFRTFKLNTDNYILYRNIKDIAADVRLTGENNASLWIHSLAGEEGMEEIHAELSQIDLDAITKDSRTSLPCEECLAPTCSMPLRTAASWLWRTLISTACSMKGDGR